MRSSLQRQQAAAAEASRKHNAAVAEAERDLAAPLTTTSRDLTALTRAKHLPDRVDAMRAALERQHAAYDRALFGAWRCAGREGDAFIAVGDAQTHFLTIS